MNNIIRVLLVGLLILSTGDVTAAKIEVSPQLKANYLHIVASDQPLGITEGDNAIVLTPSLDFSILGPMWQSKGSFKHTQVAQFEPEQEQFDYSDLSFDNRFTFLNGRLMFGANIARNHQNIDTDFTRVSDPIFGVHEYIDVDKLTASMRFATSTNSDWRNSLSVEHTVTDFDEKELQDTSSTNTRLVKGDSTRLGVSVNYGQQLKGVHGGVDVSASRNKRDNRGEQTQYNANIRLAAPIWKQLNIVVTAQKTEHQIENSVFDDSALGSENYGAGVSWSLSKRSFIEITRSKDKGAVADEYTAYKVNWVPSDRTRFQYSNSHRFYGESHSFNFNHKAKRWSFDATYSEALNSATKLLRSEREGSRYVCTITIISLEQCQLFEEGQTLLPDQIVISLREAFFELDEELVLNKSFNSVLTFRAKKTGISLSYGRSEREFIERQALQESESMSIKLNHTMTKRNALNLFADKVRTMEGQRYRASYKVGAEFERRLTRKSTAALSLNRYYNNSEPASFTALNRNDTRVDVSYRYQF